MITQVGEISDPLHETYSGSLRLLLEKLCLFLS